MTYEDIAGRTVKAISSTGSYITPCPVGKYGVVVQPIFCPDILKPYHYVFVKFPGMDINSWLWRDLRLVGTYTDKIEQHYEI